LLQSKDKNNLQLFGNSLPHSFPDNDIDQQPFPLPAPGFDQKCGKAELEQIHKAAKSGKLFDF